MGTYLNPGNRLFWECLNSSIYVDKSELVGYTNRFLNTVDKLVCVSRPRRFGKSMALQMLAAYYSRDCDSRVMFENLKLGKQAQFDREMNQYDTLYLDMQGVISDALNDPLTSRGLREFYNRLPSVSSAELEFIRHPLLTAVQRMVIRDLRESMDFAQYIEPEECSLQRALLSVYKNTGRQFVLLMDEWDCIFRNYEKDKLLQDKYIEFLREMFKNAAMLPAFALIYMTGILPVKRYGTESALNNFREYTMLNMSPLEEFAGFTEEETAELYRQYGMNFQKAQEWYDGYHLGNVVHIYNPNSVIQSVTRKNYSNYWTGTGTYESVKQLIEMNFDGLKEKVIMMLGGGRCNVNVSKFQNDMTTFRSCDDVLTLLIHLGYLGYDSARKEVYIPNKEIRDEFVNAIEGDKWSLTYAAIARSANLLEATLACDEAAVAAGIARVHEDNTSILTYNNENSLSCVIQLAYFKAQDDYWLVRELPAGKGFADIAFIPRRGSSKPAMVVELKWDKDVQTAIDQIHARNYSWHFREYFGEVLLIGISYTKGDPDKVHQCRIERVSR